MGIWIRTQDRENLVEITRLYTLPPYMIRGIDTKGFSIVLRRLYDKRKSKRNTRRNTREMNKREAENTGSEESYQYHKTI